MYGLICMDIYIHKCMNKYIIICIDNRRLINMNQYCFLSASYQSRFLWLLRVVWAAAVTSSPTPLGWQELSQVGAHTEPTLTIMHLCQETTQRIPTGTGPIIRNRLLHIGFLIFRVFWICPQAFSFRPALADAN